VSTIGLWGRSMGAATALLHGDRDPSIAGMVIDSPFSSLKTLSEELSKKHTKIPRFISNAALKMIRKSILKRAFFDINQLTPVEHGKKCFVPALFVHAKDDELIGPHHSQLIYDTYIGEKNLILVEGGHNDERPDFLFDSIGIFFYNKLHCETIPQLDENKFHSPTHLKNFSNVIDNLDTNHFKKSLVDEFDKIEDESQNLEDDEDFRKAMHDSLKEIKIEKSKNGKMNEFLWDVKKCTCREEVDTLIEKRLENLSDLSTEDKDMIRSMAISTFDGVDEFQ